MTRLSRPCFTALTTSLTHSLTHSRLLEPWPTLPRPLFPLLATPFPCPRLHSNIAPRRRPRPFHLCSRKRLRPVGARLPLSFPRAPASPAAASIDFPSVPLPVHRSPGLYTQETSKWRLRYVPRRFPRCPCRRPGADARSPNRRFLLDECADSLRSFIHTLWLYSHDSVMSFVFPALAGYWHFFDKYCRPPQLFREFRREIDTTRCSHPQHTVPIKFQRARYSTSSSSFVFLSTDGRLKGHST